MNNIKLKFPDADWSMPFLFTQGLIYVELLNHLLNESDFINNIKYVYGTPSCLWSGGRGLSYNLKNLKIVEKVIDSLSEYKITPVFTLTNTLLGKDDLQDSYCNDLLKIISENRAEVITASDILFEYIKSKYPAIKHTASVIKFFQRKFIDMEDETIYINELAKNYDRVVIRSEYFIKNSKKIKNISDLSKIVILINSTCKSDCDYAKKHYDLISKFYKKEISYTEGMNDFLLFCPKIHTPFLKRNTLTEDEIRNAMNLGITNLKLQGRQVEFHEMLEIIYRNFFDKRTDKKKLIKQADEYCSGKIQKSTDLQLYSLIKKIKS